MMAGRQIAIELSIMIVGSAAQARHGRAQGRTVPLSDSWRLRRLFDQNHIVEKLEFVMAKSWE
jgi:hypothetical protein